MNQRIFIILMLMIIVAGCAKQSIVLQDFSAAPQIHCSQIKNIENISDYVIYLNKGDEIPLKMTLDSEVIEIDNEEISVILKQKVPVIIYVFILQGSQFAQSIGNLAARQVARCVSS